MEDLPRNLGKEVNRVKLPRPTRRAKPWTLLFVGDSGKVISIKRFKGFLIALCLLLAISLAADVALFFFLQKTSRKSDTLKRKIAEQQSRLTDLRNERDRMMAKLAIVQSRLMDRTDKSVSPKEKNVAEEKPPAIEINAGIDSDDEGEKQMPSENERMDGHPEQKTPDTVVEPKQIAEKQERQEKEPVGRIGDVAVDELTISHDSVSGIITVNFNIRNNSRDRSKPLSGRTYVVLKDNSVSSDRWIVSPRVKLVSGKPGTGSRGQYFSILYYKPVTYELRGVENPGIYSTATVFVYANKKDLILEKDFSVHFDENSPEN